jgi:hypothetical protein
MAARVALVIGATGATASRLVEHLSDDPGWKVYGACRTVPAEGARFIHVGCDLMDMAAVRASFAALSDVTHVFYAARAPHGEGGLESVENNVTMLRNVLDGMKVRRTGSPMSIWSRAANGTACTSAPIARRRARTSRATSRPISTMTSRICSRLGGATAAGHGRRRDPTSCATSPRAGPAISCRSSVPTPRSAGRRMSRWTFPEPARASKPSPR